MSKGILVIVLGILMAANSYASENSNCPNLSHEDRTLLSNGGVFVYYVEQHGCESLTDYQMISGERDDIGTHTMKPEWTEQTVDDVYETTRNQQRWQWSADHQKIIHEFVIDTLDKETGTTKFSTMSVTFSQVNGKVREAGTLLVREQTAQGLVTVKSTQIDEMHEPISQ